MKQQKNDANAHIVIFLTQSLLLSVGARILGYIFVANAVVLSQELLSIALIAALRSK